MVVLTPAERRGALVVLGLLTLGSLRDVWTVWRHAATPPPFAGPAWRETSGALEGIGAEPPSARADLPGPTSGAPAPVSPPPVDLNRADEAELDALPGIGPVLAGRIVAHRRRFGPFRQPEDLLAVPGIGPRLYARLRPRIRVGPGAAAPSSAVRADAKRTANGDGRVQISLQSRAGTDR